MRFHITSRDDRFFPMFVEAAENLSPRPNCWASSLEDAADAFEHVANVVETIAVKES